MAFYAYILLCADGSLYTGHTDHLENRIADHQAGRFTGYTSKRRPIRLMWSQDFPTRHEALSAERQIKGWSRAKKLALIDGDWARLSLLARNRQSVGGSTSSPRTETALTTSGDKLTTSGDKLTTNGRNVQ